jgi:DNA processing protein
MQVLALGPADVLALSFVHGLPHAELFALLRREAPDGEERLPFDARENSGTDLPADPLEALLVQMDRLCAARIPHRWRAPRVRASADEAARARHAAGRAVAVARQRGIDPVAWGDARYPPLVAQIFDPPLVLWVRGSVDALSATLVAIVGSRAASPYGEETAARLAGELASCGLAIASGLARGIDASAHRGALAAGGLTVGVLGCGADVVYPPEHAALAGDVVRHGAIVSEYPPGTPPLPGHFPRRNRIISALSRGVLVVEARRKSGALITANCALEQGRDVMAVPGSVQSERHRGSHMLLKGGAALVENAADVLQALNLPGGANLCAQPSARDLGVAGALHVDPLLALMDAGEAYDLDTLAQASGSDVVALLPRLLELELQGSVRRAPGGRFVRSVGTC